MQMRRRLDSRPKLDDRFVISLDFHELAELFAGCTQALRSVRTPLPAVEALVEAIEQLAMDDECATMARLQLAQGPTPGSLDDALGTQEFLDSLPLTKGEPEGVPPVLIGPGGRYVREWPAAEGSMEFGVHLSLVPKTD